MRVSWSGEQTSAQEARSLFGSFSRKEQWLQLRMLVECHGISANYSKIDAWHSGAGGINQGKA
jgi:hypothetical protein